MVLISQRYLDGILIKQIGLTIQGNSKKISTTLTFLVICLVDVNVPTFFTSTTCTGVTDKTRIISIHK